MRRSARARPARRALSGRTPQRQTRPGTSSARELSDRSRPRSVTSECRVVARACEALSMRPNVGSPESRRCTVVARLPARRQRRGSAVLGGSCCGARRRRTISLIRSAASSADSCSHTRTTLQPAASRLRSVAPIASDVTRDLRIPVLGIRVRPNTVLGASVPETAVHEHRDSNRGKHDVDLTLSLSRASVELVSQAATM